MNKMFYKEESKKEYYKESSYSMTREDLKLGATLRIADAVEKIAKNYDQMQRDLEWYKKRCTTQAQEISRLSKSVAAYKGHNKKLRNKIKQ